jgi:predicted RNA-binding protein associated with RNAse of E/G family
MARQTSTPVIERKRRLDGSVVEYECEPIVIDPGKRAVLRYVIDRTLQLEGSDLVLRPGMVTIGHFWVDRPYTVYHWLDAQRSLAYYFSVATDVRIDENVVEYSDLVVDVLVKPSGESTVLDEDELPPDLDPALRAVIARALEAVATNPRRLVAEIERASREALRPQAGRTRS